jgi:hypothetical protein
VLPGYDVFDVKSNERRRLLLHAAVLAQLAGTLRTTSRTPGPILRRSLGEKAARICLHDRDQIDGLNEILVLLVGAEAEEHRSQLRCEGLGQRFQQAVQIARGGNE